jgi:hypothetical protein
MAIADARDYVKCAVPGLPAPIEVPLAAFLENRPPFLIKTLR